MDEASEKK
jgi:hypothetical protein